MRNETIHNEHQDTPPTTRHPETRCRETTPTTTRHETMRLYRETTSQVIQRQVPHIMTIYRQTTTIHPMSTILRYAGTELIVIVSTQEEHARIIAECRDGIITPEYFFRGETQTHLLFSIINSSRRLAPILVGRPGLRNIKYKLSIVYRGHRCVRNRWYGPNAMVVSQKPEIVVNSFGIRILRAVAYEC